MTKNGTNLKMLLKIERHISLEYRGQTLRINDQNITKQYRSRIADCAPTITSLFATLSTGDGLWLLHMNFGNAASCQDLNHCYRLA